MITIKEVTGIKENDENYNKYTGLGYSIQYTYYLDESQKENVIIQTVKGAEFKLIDLLPIWAWIE